MRNDSGLSPLGHAVLVRPYEPERKKSIIELPKSAEDRSALIEQRAVIVALGPECWPREKAPRAVPGDVVLIERLCGFMATGPLDGLTYRLINDADVFARIEEGNKS